MTNPDQSEAPMAAATHTINIRLAGVPSVLRARRDDKRTLCILWIALAIASTEGAFESMAEGSPWRASFSGVVALAGLAIGVAEGRAARRFNHALEART